MPNAQQHSRDAEGRPGPRRPAVLATLDQRQHDRDQRRRDQRGTDHVETAPAVGPRLGDEAARDE
jgi:hypothetical protein